MRYEKKPVCRDPTQVNASSEEVIVGHHEKNWALPRWRAGVYCVAMLLAPLLHTGAALRRHRQSFDLLSTG
jgi:hypothetical protein